MHDIWTDSELAPEQGRIIFTTDEDYQAFNYNDYKYTSALDWDILFPIRIMSAYNNSHTKAENFDFLNNQVIRKLSPKKLMRLMVSILPVLFRLAMLALMQHTNLGNQTVS